MVRSSKEWMPNSQVEPRFGGVVTSMDGRHGNIGERFNSISVQRLVTKSYAFERPNLRTRALDVHPELIFDAASAAEHIETELFERAGEVEVGLTEMDVAFAAFAEDELVNLTC